MGGLKLDSYQTLASSATQRENCHLAEVFPFLAPFGPIGALIRIPIKNGAASRLQNALLEALKRASNALFLIGMRIR